LLMWRRYTVCDACQSARATIETESGVFLCDGCEAVVVTAFQEFELPSASPIDD
jgi:ribosomal protein L37AE/L43A